MKIDDKEFIKELIASDFKPISNPDFAFNTLKRIKGSRESNEATMKTVDITVFIPVIIFAFLFTLFSIIKVILSLFEFEWTNNIKHFTEMISIILVNPVTISILISCSLLFVLDSYLNKLSKKFTKPNSRSYAITG